MKTKKWVEIKRKLANPELKELCNIGKKIHWILKDIETTTLQGQYPFPRNVSRLYYLSTMAMRRILRFYGPEVSEPVKKTMGIFRKEMKDAFDSVARVEAYKIPMKLKVFYEFLFSFLFNILFYLATTNYQNEREKIREIEEMSKIERIIEKKGRRISR